jgi:hypothetical protein
VTYALESVLLLLLFVASRIRFSVVFEETLLQLISLMLSEDVTDVLEVVLLLLLLLLLL